MTELEKLTTLCGSPKKTADALNVDVRTYWNYKAGKMPKWMGPLIALKIKELEEKQTRKAL